MGEAAKTKTLRASIPAGFIVVLTGGAAEDRTRDLLNVSHGLDAIISAFIMGFVTCKLLVAIFS